MRAAWITVPLLVAAGAIVVLATMPREQIHRVIAGVKRRTPDIARQVWRSTRNRETAIAAAPTYAPEQAANPVRSGAFLLECSAASRPISPLIYGVGGSGGSPWSTGTTARRWGGNPTTRYNWRLNTWNLSKDWFFKNVGDPTGSYDVFLEENRAHGVKTALTVPTLGWVAKDSTSWGFPASEFGQQQAMAPDNPGAGNGIGRDNKDLVPGPPTLTSVRSTPESIEEWVRTIRKGDSATDVRERRVDAYILDNEPMLWNSTHRDVHPDPTTYDELLEKTIAYASAIRRADPEAKIAGPAEWGWLAYQYSAKDVAAGVQLRPDRRIHGDEALIPWYLRRMADYEARNKIKLLDILDVHFYSMAPGLGIGKDGKTDSATAALRIRATRSLWDPSYVDESWINEKMRVIPLLKEWIAQNHPGLGVSIGEWNFGAETHMSGGLATAEALGRFGSEGLTSAYYWTNPADRSAAFWAFRAFRNFDGAGGRFLDWTVNAKGDAPLSSLFGSRDTDGAHVVAVLLNFAALSSLSSRISVQGCGAISAARAFTYTGGEAGFKPIDVTSTPDVVQATFPAYSITALDLTMSRPSR
jgi:Glycoside hydrolase family 44